MTYALNHRALRFGLTLLTLALAGCALRPAHAPDSGPIPPAYKQAQAEPTGAWSTARPADDALRGAWWTLFQDPALNALQTAAQDANPTLHAAYARLQQSRAQHRQARSALFPRLDAGFGPTRQRESPASYSGRDNGPASTTTLWRADAAVAYEADLFGRVSSTIGAASAEQARSGALYRLTLLALQADVADTYFLIRELDTQHQIYQQTLALRERGFALSQMRLEAGDGGELELERARGELEAARADALGAQRQRASAEHALAILLGKAPADFSLPPEPLRRIELAVPPGLPSELLERRPDIAAAERAMAAANARIGAARAAFFPRLELTGAAGFESSSLSQLFQWSSRTFLLGPFLGTALSLPILDGGARQADLDAARAAHDEETARYRETLLNAFREVEDNLMHLRIMAAQQTAQDRARLAAQRSAELSRLQYETGTHTQLDVIDADRSLLQQQLASARLDGDQARTTVRLIRALGGGWDTPLPGNSLSSPQASAAPAASLPLPPSPSR
ncbi:multidrug efflux system lipoprotein 2 [Achromobacter xylosoxidans A8]|uniref:Multidrug efflux system lipoprotein 2 n=1 Tax=Achromobacter xylosoxidans (strain A8) TaxID=762376 RepID=E3HX38_ACHXA|nr:efflux transporter outer membrane subunit [Achromobacter xylosoxidans]ADP16392.1 multidrug efflux system lipoprotein 2 [Achromobacter xylosoxidans A8]